MSEAVKFQTDEHIPTVVITGLQRRGIDVLSTPQAELRGASDEEQLSFATQQQRVFVTHDDDFLALHAQGIQRSGVFFIQSGQSVGYMVRGLHFIYQVVTAEEMQNHVEFL